MVLWCPVLGELVNLKCVSMYYKLSGGKGGGNF